MNRIPNRVKNGSGLSSIREPTWFHNLNETFAENNVKLNLVSSGKDTSYLNNDIVTGVKSLTKRRGKTLMNSTLSH